jgi:hypothetical protein
MEVLNRNEIRPILEEADPNVFRIPPAIMMYTSLKVFIFIVINILLMIAIIPTVWDTLNENKQKKLDTERAYILSSSRRSLDYSL